MKKKRKIDYSYLLIALLFAAIALANTGCGSQRGGCYSTRGMSGYK